MKVEDIQEKIEIAKESTEGLDADLRSTAFRVVLENLIGEN